MQDQCRVERPVRTSNGRGGTTEGWTVVYDGRCLLLRRGTLPWETELYGRQEGRANVTVYLPHGTDIRPQDVVVVRGNRYMVYGHSEPATHEIGLQVQVRVVEGRD